MFMKNKTLVLLEGFDNVSILNANDYLPVRT